MIAVSTTADLIERIRANDATWERMTPTEREAARARYVADGWTVCAHPSCPPYDCRAAR